MSTRQHLSRQGPVVAALLEPALWEWAHASGWDSHEQVNVVGFGSSTMWGQNVQALPERNFLNVSQRMVSGRAGKYYAPPHLTGTTVTQSAGWTISGTMTDFNQGINTHAANFGGGAFLERTVEDTTGFQLYFQQGGSVGQFTVSIDGGAAVAVTPTTDKFAARMDGVWTSPLLTRGNHTIKITSVGTVIFSGMYAFDGHNSRQAAAVQANPATLQGVRFINAGYPGGFASWWSGNGTPARSFTRWAALFDPKLYVVMQGSNDWGGNISVADYKAQMISAIKQLKSVSSGDPSFLLLQQYLRYAGTDPDPWPSYGVALQEIATEIPNVAFLDTSQHFPVSQEADADDLIDSDSYHPTGRGHGTIARAVADCLNRPLAAITAPPRPTFTVGADPATLTGLVSAWRASDLVGANGTAVSTWSPYAGSQAVALVQATGGNQPTIVRPAVANGPSVKTELSGKWLRSSAAWSTVLNGALTVLVVAKAGTPSNTPYGTLFDGRITTERAAVRYTGNVQVTVDAQGTTQTAMGGGHRWLVYAVVFDGAATTYRTDRTDPATLTSVTAGANYGLDGLTIGADPSNALPLDAEYAEIMVFNRALTTQEQTDSIGYLARKYALDGVGKTNVA
jgi:lysophospholipase L1-like esterase